MSSPPATTSVPGASPVWLDASPDTWPTTVPASTTSGTKAVPRPHRASSSGDQARRPRSNSPEVEPIDASVASVPVSRNTIQSAIMLSRVAAAHTPGSWRCTHASRGAALSDSQPPPRRYSSAAVPSASMTAASRSARVSPLAQAHSSCPPRL